jgi:hypothetical protein
VAEEMDLSFSDITFANFEGLVVDMGAWRHRFEAGDPPCGDAFSVTPSTD